MDRVALIIPHFHAERQNNLGGIISAAKNQDYPLTEIIVFNNNPKYKLAIDGVTCINSNKNFGSSVRLAIAVSVPAEYYIFHDDDLSMGPSVVSDVMGILKTKSVDIVGFVGSTLGGIDNPYKGRRHINATKLKKSYGVDIVLGRLSAMSRETLGRGISFMSRIGLDIAWTHEDIPMSLASLSNMVLPLDIQELPTGGVGLEHQIGHYDKRDELTKICLKLL